MPPKRKKTSRFDYPVIVERIRAAQQAAGRSTLDLCSAAGIAPSAWYRKSLRRGSSFSLDELASIAEALDAPAGWPFIDWRSAP